MNVLFEKDGCASISTAVRDDRIGINLTLRDVVIGQGGLVRPPLATTRE